MTRRLDVDWMLLLVSLGLAAVGVVALAGAHGPQGVLAVRQAVWIGLGLVGLAVFLLVPYRTWGELAPLLYGLGIASLVVVLAVGRRVNGSKSWIAVGSFVFQPSELMKVCTVLVLAKLASGHRRETASLGLIALSAAAVGVPMLLVLLQPDMGTALIFAVLAAALLATVGFSRRTWAVILVAAVVAGAAGWTYVLKDYQKERIRTFFNPESDARATGYQIIQARIAIGSGGLAGRGWAAGTQSQLDFVPEKHTDFIFPVVAEEWGLLGSLAVLGLYGVLLARGLRIAVEAREAFGAYVVLGIMAVVATHVLINLGMVTGLLPTIGIPLPLVSYGGSSMVSTLAGVGLVLNVRARRIANA